MAESTSSFFDPLYSFIFDAGGGSRKSGALSYDELQTRRKLALALATRNRKFPTNIGEGLTYLGEALAERRDRQEYEAAEAAQRQQDLQFRQNIPGAPGAAPQAAAPVENYAPAPARMPAPPSRAAIDEEPVVQQASLAPQSQEITAPRTQPMPAVPGSMSIDDWMTRIKRNESGGAKGDPYQLVGQRSRRGDYPYGAYQVMGENIPAWTKTHLGTEMTPQQFLADPKAQDAVARAQGGMYLNKYGPERAAAAWFAGERGMNDPNRRDTLGTNVAEYVRRFNRPSPREEIASSLATGQGASPAGEAEARLQDVVGVQQPRVQLAARNEPVSDAPPLSAVDTGVAQSVQQRRDDIARSVAGQQTPAPQSVAAPPAAPQAPVQIAQAPGQQIKQAPMSYPNAERVYGPLRPEPQPPQIRPASPEENYLRNPPTTISDRAREDALLRAKQMEQQRKDEHAQAMAQFGLDKQAWGEDRRKYMEYEAGVPQQQRQEQTHISQQAAAAQSLEESKIKTHGIDKSVEATQASPEMLQRAVRIRQAIDSGALTGILGPTELNLLRAKAAVTGQEDPRIATTQKLQADLRGVAAAGRAAIVGPGQVTVYEQQMLEQAAAGNISFSPQAIRDVTAIAEKAMLSGMIKHQAKLEQFGRENPALAQTMYDRYGIRMEEVLPQDHPSVQRLLDNLDNPRAIADFDKKFHTPGLALKIIERSQR